jgi:phenylalanyl-tRNA synthetase beta chain
MDAIWSAPTAGLLRNAVLFDIYRPKSAKDLDAPGSEKSYAIRLTLNSDDATLTEEQIDNATQAVLASLLSKLGARQRT